MTRRLLILAPSWLGDSVMALPAIGDVVRGTAGTSVDVAARASVAPLFTMVGGIGRILTLASGAESLALLREGRYDAALLLPNSFNSAWLIYRAGIKERWGYRADGRSFLLTRPVDPPVRVHQTDYYRTLARALGFPGDGAVSQLTVSAGQRAAGAASLAAEGWDGQSRLVALAPGAVGGSAKRWPPSSFGALADRLADRGHRTVLVGSAGDRPTADAVLAAAAGPIRPIDLVGRTDLPGLAGVLVHCRALVSNDSGAMHVASALGLNITALIGPTSERETGPVGTGRYDVLTNPVWCRPCLLHECPLMHRCMTGIKVETVAAATEALL